MQAAAPHEWAGTDRRWIHRNRCRPYALSTSRGPGADLIPKKTSLRTGLAGVLIAGGVLLVAFGVIPSLVADGQPLPTTTSTDPTSSVVTTTVVDDAQAGRAPENRSEVVPGPSSGAVVAEPDVLPLSIQIPKINVRSDLVDLGLNPDRTIEVPTDFDVAGWYVNRSVPGNVGPGVILGHVDSYTGPAVFFQLGTLVAGDRVQVTRSDGSIAVFAVTSVEQHGKEVGEFPTDRVYGQTDEPTLRLITCGGSFDRSARSYDDNIIVFAEFVEIVEPARTLS